MTLLTVREHELVLHACQEPTLVKALALVARSDVPIESCFKAVLENWKPDEASIYKMGYKIGSEIEREECARICDVEARCLIGTENRWLAERIAKLIRARGPI